MISITTKGEICVIQLKEDNYRFLNIELEVGETIVTEAGGMSWMSENMKMETKGGGFGVTFSESLFLNEFTPVGGSFKCTSR